MGKDDNITLVNENNLNEYKEVNLLCAFELNDNRYIVYNKDEYDYDGNSIIYCGRIDNRNNKQYIQNIYGEEYNKIKNIIKYMIDYNSEVSNV